MTSVACIADTHLSSGLPLESDAFYPRYIRSLGHAGEAFFQRLSAETGRAFEACAESLRAAKPDRIVHLGDVTGGWQERGMCHPSVQGIARGAIETLRAASDDVLFCVGNHDTGYARRGSVDGAGLRAESIDICQEVFGDLFWSRTDACMLSIGICSPLAEYEGSEQRLRRLRAAQETFVRDRLSAHRDRPWTLFTHDLAAVGHLAHALAPHASRCGAIVFGDLHHPFNARIVRMLHAAMRPGLLSLLRKAHLCPSVAPLWWGGYRRLDIAVRDGRIGTAHVSIPKPHDHDRLPSSSAAWALAAMLRPRLAVAMERVRVV